MASKPEQIGRDRRIVRVDGRWVKRQTSRHRRRAERRDVETAPTKRGAYRGWVA